MAFMTDVDAEDLELFDQALDLFFDGISAHVPEVFVAGSAEHLEDRARKPIRHGDFRFVGSHPGLKLPVFESVVGAALLLCAVGGLDEELS